MIRNYLKIAWKVLQRKKFFTMISLFGISITLAVLMVVTSLLDHTLAPNSPEVNLDRTLFTARVSLTGESYVINSHHSYYFLNNFIRKMKTPELISVYSNNSEVHVYLDRSKKTFSFRTTDGDYWKFMDYSFLEGRPFRTDEVTSAQPVAVISRKVRDELFGSGSALGQFVRVANVNYRIVGIVENVSLIQEDAYSDIWVPTTVHDRELDEINLYGNYRAALLASQKEDIPAIKKEFQKMVNSVDLSVSDFLSSRIDTMTSSAATRVESIASGLSQSLGLIKEGETSGSLLFYLTTVGAMILFMLLPSINLVNINLSRILERMSEIGVRKSFGATRKTLVGQFIVENLILTLLGGLLGLALSYILIQLITESGIVPFAKLSLNLRVFLFSFVICIVFGLISGVYPAWRMSRMHPVDALRGGVE